MQNKSKKRNIQNVILIVLLVFLVSGCGQSMEPEVSSIFIDNKGQVTGAWIEDFSQDNYNLEELIEMTNSEIATYNDYIQEERVKLISLTEENNIVKLMIQYKSYEDYKNMNQEELFVGTVTHAIEKGYEFEAALADVKNPDKMLEQSGIHELGDRKVVITNEPMHIVVPKNIKFYSEQASLINEKEIDNFYLDGFTYIIY